MNASWQEDGGGSCRVVRAREQQGSSPPLLGGNGQGRPGGHGRDDGPRVRRPRPDARPRARSRGKPHPEAYRRALRTLGDEVQAVRRVVGAGREEVGVPQLCVSHGWRGYRRGLSHPARVRCLMIRTTDKGGDMTSTTRIPPAEITGIKGALMKRMATKMVGQVPTPLGVYWHNPKVLKASFAIGNKVEKWDTCDENLKSFAHMAVASLVGCTWCLDFNYFQAHNENLDL